MTGRIVNLRTRRKQNARDEKRKAAGDGPAPGVAKPERDRVAAENRRACERLEGHRRDDEA